MNCRDRVLKTMAFEEPDRVPITEMDIDIPLTETITGERFPAAISLQTPVITDRNMERRRVELKLRCYRKIGFDLLPIDLSTPEDWTPKMNPDGTMIDLWGRVLKLDEGTRAWVPYSTIFDEPEDYKEFQLPDPDAPGLTLSVEHAKEKMGGDLALAAFVRDPFAHAWEIFTPMKFVLWMYRDPGFVRRAIDDITDYNIGLIRRIAEVGVDLIIDGGDFCDVKGPMVPTSFFREVIFPNLKRQADEAHRAGIKFVKHTDGNINPILSDFAETVDGLHSLDPSAGVDIGRVKEEYGDKLILLGNVSVDNLARRSRDEIVEEVKTCIRKASPGGGHILSSSNSWAAGVKLDNCMAMVEAGRKYGVYPINPKSP